MGTFILFLESSCIPEKRTMVLNHQQESRSDEEKTCLSRQPVEVCPRSCSEPVQEKRERVSFLCLPTHSSYTRRLVREAEVRPLYELANKDIEYSRSLEVTIPVSCRPYY